MDYKKPSVSRWVCLDSEVAILSCRGNQNEFTRNPLWRWSPNLLSIWWCSGVTPWPWFVPYQRLGASGMCLSGATKPEWGCPDARAETEQRGEGGPNRLVWKEPLLPRSLRGTGWRLGYLSNREASPPACPQQELLCEAGPVLAAGLDGLVAMLGDASCASTLALAGKLPSSSAVPSRYSGERF